MSRLRNRANFARTLLGTVAAFGLLGGVAFAQSVNGGGVGGGAGASSLVVGATPVLNGTTTRILYDNVGILGEYTLTGTGTVVAMRTSPQLITPNLGVATGTSLVNTVTTPGGDEFTAANTNAGTTGTLKLCVASGAGRCINGTAQNDTALYASGSGKLWFSVDNGTTGLGYISSTGLNAMNIGATTPGTGAFTTLNITSLPQTSVAQSGTMCYNVSSAVTYDATLGCLASLPELKDIHSYITVNLADIERLKPIWFSWKKGTPEWKGGDHAVQPGFNAREVAAIPFIGERLTAKDTSGKLRGVRYAEMAAYLQAEIIALKSANDNLSARISKLEEKRR